MIRVFYSLKKNINDRLFKKLKKSQYLKDKELVKLITSVKDFETINKNNKNIVSIRLDYVEKRDIDRSTIYSIDGPFQLILADIANLEFDMFTSKIYSYPMRSRRNLAKKLNEYYIDVAKRKATKGCVFRLIQSFSKMKWKS